VGRQRDLRLDTAGADDRRVDAGQVFERAARNDICCSLESRRCLGMQVDFDPNSRSNPSVSLLAAVNDSARFLFTAKSAKKGKKDTFSASSVSFAVQNMRLGNRQNVITRAPICGSSETFSVGRVGGRSRSTRLRRRRRRRASRRRCRVARCIGRAYRRGVLCRAGLGADR
jgi:hypothetical protein